MEQTIKKINGVAEYLGMPFVKGNFVFFILMYLLGLTNIILEPWNGSRFWMSLELFSDLYFLCLFLLVFSNKHRQWIRYILAFIFYLLSVVDMACYVRLSMPIAPMLLQLVLQSSIREAKEALASYIDLNMFDYRLSLVLLQFLGGIYVLWKEKVIVDKLRKVLGDNYSIIKVIGIVYSFVLFVIGFIFSWENKEYMYYRIIRQYSELETQKVKDFSQKTNFYLPIYRLAYSISETHRLQGEIKQFERSMDKAQVDSVDYLSPHIVVIIGESYNRYHSTLYGYDKDTTPLQCKRWDKGEMVLFTDMISSWNTTCESFKNMFSTQYVGQDGTWASAPPFPLLFKKAGYHTTFLSNQYVVEKVGFSDFIEDAFFNNPQTSSKMFDSRNNAIHDYDRSLLEDYARLGIEKYPYTLDIFHFLGLHADFSMRYPASFARFSANDYDRKDLSVESKQIIADYDNAILYNDFVIDCILRLYDNKDAIVIFVPDHGERVFDNSTEWGRNLTWNKNDIRQQFEIPFWIWTSSKYRINHQKVWIDIQKASNKRGMTDTLAQMLLHIAGIHTKWYYPEMDILNDKYNNNRKRIIRGEKDYDRIVCN